VSLKLRLLIGDRDFTLAANRQFSAHLTRLGVPHDYVELNGVAHDTMAILNALGEANWRFYRDALPAN
jgi:acetyl esterase/lipase